MKPTNYAWHRAAGDRQYLEESIAQADAGNFVTPSCGCVFCDIGLAPTKLRRQYVHYIRKEGKIIVCPIKGIKPHEQARSNDAD